MNGEAEFEIPIYNLVSERGGTAGLLIDRAVSSGVSDVGPSPLLIEAGASGTVTGRFDTSQLGFQSTTISVFGRDELVPGSRAMDPLEVTITATVVEASGDFNANGVLDVGDVDRLALAIADFVVVFRAGEYDDGIDQNSTWATGDWNGDSEFNSSDFVLAFSSGGYEMGPRTQIVPESETQFGPLVALLVWLGRRWRSSH